MQNSEKKEALDKLKNFREVKDKHEKRQGKLAWAWEIQWKINKLLGSFWNWLKSDTGYGNLKWLFGLIIGFILGVISYKLTHTC